MLTRKEYLDGKCTLEEYYGEIGEESGISYANASDLERYKKAYKEDVHFNNIPLSEWDMRASNVSREAFEKRGDFWSIAGGVCVHKTMARKAVENG